MKGDIVENTDKTEFLDKTMRGLPDTFKDQLKELK